MSFLRHRFQGEEWEVRKKDGLPNVQFEDNEKAIAMKAIGKCNKDNEDTRDTMMQFSLPNITRMTLHVAVPIKSYSYKRKSTSFGTPPGESEPSIHAEEMNQDMKRSTWTKKAFPTRRVVEKVT